MINAAATFLTLGHLQSATIVNKFPHIPTIIIRIVITAANVRSGRANLKRIWNFGIVSWKNGVKYFFHSVTSRCIKEICYGVIQF